MSDNSTIISEWFHQYSDDVYDYLVYYTGSTDVEDLVQEAFIKAYKGLKSFRERSSPKTWLFSVARHVAIDEARKRKRRIWNNTTSLNEEVTSDKQTPESILFQNEAKRELYKALQKLKENYRDVVILRGIKEMSVAETAAILNWKEEKVRTNYHRGLKSLKNQYRGALSDEE